MERSDTKWNTTVILAWAGSVWDENLLLSFLHGQLSTISDSMLDKLILPKSKLVELDFLK